MVFKSEFRDRCRQTNLPFDPFSGFTSFHDKNAGSPAGPISPGRPGAPSRPASPGAPGGPAIPSAPASPGYPRSPAIPAGPVKSERVQRISFIHELISLRTHGARNAVKSTFAFVALESRPAIRTPTADITYCKGRSFQRLDSKFFLRILIDLTFFAIVSLRSWCSRPSCFTSFTNRSRSAGNSRSAVS